MPTSVISDTTTDPSGAAVGSVPVTISLFRAGALASGFRISDQTQVASTVSLTSNGAGVWSSGLEQNANIFPAGTYYVINYAYTATQGYPKDWAILVGSGAQTVGQALIIAPPSVPVPTTASLVLTSNNTFTGTNQFNANVYFKSGSPWYDVKAFGALGDGVTDDTVNIQSAITTANASGGTVFFPPGTYKITGTLKFNSNVRLIGSGRVVTTIKAASLTSALLQSTSTSTRFYRVEIMEMTVDNTSSAAVGGIGIDFTFITSGALTNVEVQNCETGVLIAGTAYYNECRDVLASSCVTGWKITGNETKVFAGRANSCTTGFIIDNCSNVVLYSPAIEVFTTGISVAPTAATLNATINNARLENVPTSGTGILNNAAAVQTVINTYYAAGLTNEYIDNSTSKDTEVISPYGATGWVTGKNRIITRGPMFVDLQQNQQSVIYWSTTTSLLLFRNNTDSAYVGIDVGAATFRGAVTMSSQLTLQNGVNVVIGQSTGSKIGDTNVARIAFWGVSPTTQLARPTDAASIITAGTAIGIWA